jgi:hypothetical protein
MSLAATNQENAPGKGYQMPVRDRLATKPKDVVCRKCRGTFRGEARHMYCAICLIPAAAEILWAKPKKSPGGKTGGRRQKIA